MQANLSGIDLDHVMGGGLPVGVSRGKRVPLAWFDVGCQYPPPMDVDPPRNRVRPHLLRRLGLQRV